MVGLQIYRNKSLILIHTEKGKESYKCCNKTATREGNITTANLGSFYITQRLYSGPPFLSSSNTQNHQEKANHIVSLLFASSSFCFITTFGYLKLPLDHPSMIPSEEPLLLPRLSAPQASPQLNTVLTYISFHFLSSFFLVNLHIRLYIHACIFMRLSLSPICERSFRI